MVSDVFSIPLAVPHAAGAPASASLSAGPRLVLRHFVGGPENRLLQAAVVALSEDRSAATPLSWGQTANPIFLFGPTGVGKTVLAHAFAMLWNERNRMVSPLPATERPSAWVLDESADGWRKRTRQVALIHKIDTCVRQFVPVIVTGHVSPIADSQLDAPLASRLSAGLTIPVKPPGSESRRVILQQLAEQRELQWESTALRFAVDHWQHTVPQLQALLDRCLLELAGSRPMITTRVVRALMMDQQRTVPQQISDIRRLVARYFRIPIRQLTGPSRQRTCVNARAIGMYLARQITGCGLQQIGQQFGGRDHTTVLHACQKIDALMSHDPETRQAVAEISGHLRSP